MTALHEMGHAVVARLLGVSLGRVIVGEGRPLFSLPFLGTRLEFRRYPFGGMTLIRDMRVEGFRLRHWLITAGGPLVHVVLIAAFFWIYHDSFRVNSYARNWDLPHAFLFTNVLCLLLTLCPLRWQHAPVRLPSDGLQMLRTPFLTEVEIRGLISSAYLAKARDLVLGNRLEEGRKLYYEGLQANPDSSELKFELVVLKFRAEDYAGARDDLKSLLGGANLHPFVKMLSLNNIAAADILLDRPELLEEADRCSAEAMTELAWNPSILGTRGLTAVH